MTSRTRYFVIASLLILTVGLGTGLLAYYVGFPTSAFTRRGGPDELQFVPKDAAVIAYADVREVMTSELRQRVKAAAPVPENGQREFRDETGINIETDIDRVVACLDPGQGDHGLRRRPGAGARPVRRGRGSSRSCASTAAASRTTAASACSSSTPAHQNDAARRRRRGAGRQKAERRAREPRAVVPRAGPRRRRQRRARPQGHRPPARRRERHRPTTS